MMSALGRPDVPLRLNIVRAIITLLAVPAGALSGIAGVACAVLGRNLIGAAFDLFAYRKISGNPASEFVRINVRALLYCVPMLAVATIVGLAMSQSSSLSRLAVVSFTSISIYILTLVLLNAPVVAHVKRASARFRST